MKIKKIIFASIFSTFLSLSLYAQNIGDRIYKELLIDGKTVYKWCDISSIKQFSETGKIKLEKNDHKTIMYTYDENDRLISDTEGMIYKYDSVGNLIYFKNSSWNNELFYEYDDKGNKIHCISSKNYEDWFEYDNNNNLIHQSEDSTNPSEKGKNKYNYYYEYDSNNNLIHYYEVDNSNTTTCDEVISYDNKNQKIYHKTIFYNNGKITYTGESFYQYDSDGNLSFIKSTSIDKNNKKSSNDKSYKYYERNSFTYIYCTYQDSSGLSYSNIIETEYWDKGKKLPKNEITYKYQ